MRNILFLFLLVQIAFPVDFFAQEGHFYFKKKNKKSVKLKFEIINNLIIIPLKINNSDTLKFILDTGVKTTLITELAVGDSVSLNFAKKVELHGFGSGEALEAFYSKDNEIEISQIIGTGMEVNVLIDNIFNLTQKFGTRIHGIIGYEVFKDFVVEINYIKKELTFYRPETYKPKINSKTDIVKLYIKNRKPYIHTYISTVTDSLIPLRLLLDTGASDALWLLPTSDSRLLVGEPFIETYLGKGINGDIFGKKARLEKMQLAKFQLNDVLASYPDSDFVKEQLLGDGRNGNIGGEILRRFTVTIDYQNKRMFLKKNKHFKKTFDYNLSGIELVMLLPDFPIYTISYIRPDSPAEIADLQNGDQIVSINNQSTVNLKLYEVSKLLEGSDRKKIKIVVLRNGVEIKKEFRLKKIL